MNKSFLMPLLLCLFVFFGCQYKQTILIKPNEVNKSIGTAEFYEDGRQVVVYDVVLGRNGISAQKIEGDGNTPVGEYSISTIFGKDDFGITNMPFVKTSKTLHCVDDINSGNYNKLVDSTKTNKDYESYEEMLRDDGLYDMGAVIDYNKNGVRGLGSCIFLHIKSDKPTAGCVSMDAKELRELLLRLDNRKNPIIKINP
jgi:L,D-peptidoglycan transpeptidase YkuD (ErfK/YbiS/YcfS/YnhG family)